MSLGNDFTKDYGERSGEYMDNLDFATLEEIKSKALRDLTDEDLVRVGFKKVNHDEFHDFFCYEDLNGLKVYVNRVDGKFRTSRVHAAKRKRYSFYSGIIRRNSNKMATQNEVKTSDCR